MNKVNVLVTSVGGGSHGSSIVKALLISKLPLRIFGVDMSPRMLMTSPLKETAVVPSAAADNYVESIVALIRTHSIQCVFTGSEAELVRLSTHRDEIAAAGAMIFLNNARVVDLCKDKFACSQALAALGFDVPRVVLLHTPGDVDTIDFLPAIIKPSVDSGASANVFAAHNRDDLHFLAEYLLRGGLTIIAQEYLPYSENEYTVGVSTLLEKPEVVASIAMRKFMEGLTRSRTQGGVVISSGISQGEFQAFPMIRETCERIAVALGSTGPLNIQLRLVGDRVLPFEINPRFSGTTSARAYNGYNDPEFYIRKYILKDHDAASSLVGYGTGFAVKGLDERYVPYT